MSSLWVLGLGASLGYLLMKQQRVASRLDTAVREWERHESVQSADPSGATMQEIKGVWKSTKDVDQETRAFNERLPQSDRAPILAKEQVRNQEAVAYDQAQGDAQKIQGVWLDGVPF